MSTLGAGNRVLSHVQQPLVPILEDPSSDDMADYSN